MDAEKMARELLAAELRVSGYEYLAKSVEDGTATDANDPKEPLNISLRAIKNALSQPVGAGEGFVVVPRVPTDGLLMSMAIRSDHALGCPGYYDQPIFGGEGVGHAKRLAATISSMRQLHEEVVGAGFYKPERENEYSTLATPTPPAAEDAREYRLFDSQWVNVVNHDRRYESMDKEDAINLAVKLTEQAMAKNITDGKWPKPRVKAAAMSGDGEGK